MKTKKNLKSKLLTFLALLLVTGQAVLPSGVVMADVLDTKIEVTQEKPNEEQNEITEVQKEELKEVLPVVPNETDKVDKVLDEVAKGNDSPLDKNEELTFEEFLSKNQLVMGDDGNIYTTTESSYVNGLNLNDQLSSKLPQSRSLRGSEIVNVPSSANIADLRFSFSNGNSEYGWFGKRNSANEVLWCVQQGVAVNVGTNGGYTVTVVDNTLSKNIGLASYFGYYTKGKNLTNEFLTQLYIYELQGINLTSLSGVLNWSDYNAHKQYIQNKIKEYNTEPKFDKSNVSIKVGESITLTDTTGAFANYKNEPVKNDTGAKVVKNGNKVTITPNKNSKDGYIYFQYNVIPSYQGTPLLYEHQYTQNTILGRIGDPRTTRIPIKVIKQGNVQFKKIDEQTKQALPNAKFKLTYNGKTENVIANDKGIVELKDLEAGTKGTIQEVQAPNGYFLNAKEYPFTVVAGETIVVEITNKKLQGQVTMTKTGEKATNIETKDTDYGKLYQFNFTQELLKEVTFDIFADEDVVTGDNVIQSKKDDKVTSFTTNELGKATSSPLYIGKYRAVEVQAPNGFNKKSEPIHFEIKDEGQLVELTQTDIEAENKWNTAKVSVNKLDEKLVEYKENQAIIEEVPSNDKVFGLFTDEAYSYDGKELVGKDQLVGLAETKDGVAQFEGQYPSIKYYAKELNSGKDHILNDKKYPVTLVPTDNREELEVNIFEDETLLNDENNNRMARNPIINKLFKTNVPFEKINETAKLKQEEGYTYDFNQKGEGAEFELRNVFNKVIQTATIDKDGKAEWKDLVVGTYFFNETKPSNDSLVLDKTVYRIEVTQETVKIINEATQEILAEKKNELEVAETEDTTKEETTESETSKEDTELPIVETEKEVEPLLTIKNRMKRGIVVLEKTDLTTNKLLPNAKFSLKNEEGIVVYKGTTDNEGKINFKDLPVGKYTMTEVEAPSGYMNDTKPISFEIKQDKEIVKLQVTNVKKVDKLRQTKAQEQMKQAVISVLMTILLVVSYMVFFYDKKNNKELY